MLADKNTGIGKGRLGLLFAEVHLFSGGGTFGASLSRTLPNAPIPCSRPLEV